MYHFSKKIILTAIIISGIFFVATPPALAKFELSRGIIGNLQDLGGACISKGDCDWCDFVSLMVILQKTILSIFGGIALILVIWGGVSIVTAAWNEENIAANKKLITSTLMGVLIILGAYFLVHFIVIAVTNAPGQAPKSLLFSENWWEAQCASKNQICEGNVDGSLTKINPDFTYKCKSTCGTNEIIRTDGACFGGNNQRDKRVCCAKKK